MNSPLLKKLCTVLIFPLLYLAFTLHTGVPQNANAAQVWGQETQTNFRLLTEAAMVNSTDFELEDAVTFQLFNGVTMERIKAANPVTGETISGTFLDGYLVDEVALRKAAMTEWRAEHGALTPGLLHKLEQLRADETLDVAVWLSLPIQALQKRDHAPLSTGGFAVSQPGSTAGPMGTRTELDERDLARAAAESAAFKVENLEDLQVQVEPALSQFMEYAAANGLTVQYASPLAPLLYLSNVTQAQLATLAALPEVATIHDADEPGGPTLSVARPAQNANWLESLGSYTGNGVHVAVVEGERVTESNPFLTVVDVRDNNYTPMWHPTHVAGIIASIDGTIRGLAPGADIYSANGDDYATVAANSLAIDWGSTQATVLNLSFWNENCGDSSTLQSTDIQMDYVARYNFDLAVIAAGNFNTSGCGSSGAEYVSSPGKGFNSLTVGNFNDNGTSSWSDDGMNPDSQYNHDNTPNPRHKPEMAASGTSITSLSLSSPWNDTIATGTSMAAPMVAAVAANMIEADPILDIYPEAISAVLMATALHNIEGNQDTSRVDGVGSLDASAALVSVERGHWASQSISGSTIFPLDFYQFAYAGERVRYVIRWLSNPAPDYSSDPQPPDLDLKVYRADGTFLQGNNWTANSFEIVDFVAPASENYRFEVSLDGSWSGGTTYLGRGWWVGTYRISPDTAYADTMASPMGRHISVHPTDWSPTDYWRAFGIRSESSDHELELYNRSIFDDPGLRSNLTGSYSGADQVDLIAVDGNHWPPPDEEQYLVYNYSGAGGYDVSWSNLGLALTSPGVYGPYSFGSSEVVKVFDVYSLSGTTMDVHVVPVDAMDLGTLLFKSTAGMSTTYRQGKGDAVESADTAPAGGRELLSYTNSSGANDYLGLVVYKNDSTSGQFYVHIDPFELYLPLISR